MELRVLIEVHRFCAAEGAINVVEMLFSTSLVAVVGAGQQVFLCLIYDFFRVRWNVFVSENISFLPWRMS